MSARTATLGVLGLIAVVSAVVILRADLANDDRPVRRWVEALLPLVGVLALVWWAWLAL